MLHEVYNRGLDALVFFSSPIVIALLFVAGLLVFLFVLYILKFVCEKILRIEIVHSELTEFIFLSGGVLAFASLAFHAVFGRFNVDYANGVYESAESLNSVGLWGYYVFAGSLGLISLASLSVFIRSLVLKINELKAKKQTKKEKKFKKTKSKKSETKEKFAEPKDEPIQEETAE